MQPPNSREMQSAGQIGIQELQNGHQQQIQGQFDHSSASHDDFFDQMLSNLPTAWADLGTAKSPWDLANGSATDAAGGVHKLFGLGLAGKTAADDAGEGDYGGGGAYDESTLLASRLRQHQISGGGGGSPSGKPMLQLNHLHHPSQQQMLLNMVRSPGAAVGGDPGLLPLPLSLGSGSGADSSHLLVDQSRDEGDGLYNGFGGSLRATAAAQNTNQQHFHSPQGGSMPVQNYGAGPGPAPAAGQNGAAAAPPRQRVRARRGQATDPHSIAERLRRERIAERMKALQELVPNANKTDKASMLDEIIDYVKFLQLQVKVLSMSRLGGAAAVAPLVADVSSEAGRGGAGAAGSDSLAVAENQVAKLMEEDMGSAMQYLQGKGLCLMPISLASAISTATCHPRAAAGLLGTAAGGNPGLIPAALMGDAPSSPSMSVLTVQSAMANGGGDAGNNKDNAAVSKP